MVAKVKEIEEWLRKLEETDLVSVTMKNGISYLRAYSINGYSKNYPELEMN
jgi:hypothetical protein